jgi:hypothetical protein
MSRKPAPPRFSAEEFEQAVLAIAQEAIELDVPRNRLFNSVAFALLALEKVCPDRTPDKRIPGLNVIIRQLMADAEREHNAREVRRRQELEILRPPPARIG